MRYLGLIFLFSVTAFASTDVWNSQAALLNFESSPLPALENSRLSDRTKSLLIQSCQARIHEQNSFRVGDHTGSVYHVSQLSTSQELTSHCIGRVGESACIKESLRAALNNCIASQLAEAELKEAL